MTPRPLAGRPISSMLAGWEGLRRFWRTLLLTILISGSVFESLGPSSRPTKTVQKAVVPPVVLPIEATSSTVVPFNSYRPAFQLTLPGRITAGPIANPVPLLLESNPADPQSKLPRISLDGRTPMATYAAGFNPSNLRPRVGILIAGIGMNKPDSLTAIKELPGGVTLAFSPYASDLDHLLEVARMTEHEYLISIPMEPTGYALNDPDNRHALMTSLRQAENLNRLRWALSRISGYIGVTGTFGNMHGERLTSVRDQLDPLLEELGNRGLLFVDTQPGQPLLPHSWHRGANMFLDGDPIDASSLDQRLDELGHLALKKGSALGIVSLPRPIVVERVAAWTNKLVATGFALAPVSALVLPPHK